MTFKPYFTLGYAAGRCDESNEDLLPGDNLTYNTMQELVHWTCPEQPGLQLNIFQWNGWNYVWPENRLASLDEVTDKVNKLIKEPRPKLRWFVIYSNWYMLPNTSDITDRWRATDAYSTNYTLIKRLRKEDREWTIDLAHFKTQARIK